jgi:hypothetical protein
MRRESKAKAAVFADMETSCVMRLSYRDDLRVRLKKIIRILPDGKNSADAIGIRTESQ